MKKFLPTVILLVFFLQFTSVAYAQTIKYEDVLAQCDAQSIPRENCYIPDKDVQFAAKNAVRARDLINQVLGNYKWFQTGQGSSIDFGQIWIPIRNIVYAVLGLFILAAAFLMIITRGKSLTVRKFIPRFILVLVLVTLSFSLIQFLYIIGDTVQQFVLKTPNPICQPDHQNISDCDLLKISFKYDDPSVLNYQIGLRRPEPKYDEVVFTTILMTKLTAVSYYAMFAILIIRKIILWFFLIVSPIFPLLLLFPLIRNSAKIWIGEFFRWLLYAPLFTLFLQGLVQLWFHGGIGFHCYDSGLDPNQFYVTATDILLGGPCQAVGVKNNLNSPETFIQYLVALLMLWIVIILPFILLKIFLDYIYNFSMVESNIIKYLAMNGPAMSRLNKYGLFQGSGVGSTVPPAPGTPPSASTGMARRIGEEVAARQPATTGVSKPIFSEKALKIEQEAAAAQQAQAAAAKLATTGIANKIEEQVAAQNMAGAGAAQPAMSEAAMKMEASIAASQQAAEQATAAATTVASQAATPGVTVVVSREEARSTPLATIYPRVAANFDRFTATITEPLTQMTQNFKEALIDVFNITNLSIPTLKDVARFETEIETKEVSERVESSKISEIINRIAGISPIATPTEKEQYAGIREKLVSESQKGNAIAESIISAAVPDQANIGEVNLVQQVSVDDYEQIKKLWKENYSKVNPPMGPDGKPQDRKKWLMEDIKKIPQVIDLLLSGDPTKVAQGKEMVSKILPFLLLGGFSKAEIIAYLKAKLAAAKEVMEEMLQVEKDEESKIKVDRKEEEKPKAMEAQAQIPTEQLPKPPEDSS